VTAGYIGSLPKDPKNDATYNYKYEPGNNFNACLRARSETIANRYILVTFGPNDYTAAGNTEGYQCEHGSNTYEFIN
jgi:hypothetical protein